jgi:two-component system, chemotaxis family, CheB/CheR fusion protein
MNPKEPAKKPNQSKANVSNVAKSPHNAKQDSHQSFPIVAIGASAGGLEAFTELLNHLATDTGMAFVLIQHLSPNYKSMLNQILSRTTMMPVQEVKDGMVVEPNHVYVIPPNTQMTIADGHSGCAVRC